MKNKTDFITRFLTKNKCSGCLKIVFLMFALYVFPAMADGIVHTRYQAKVLDNGQLGVDTRFQIELPEQLQDALKQGVPLDFVLSYRLEKPTLASYRFKLTQLIGTENGVNYRLTYHPLTGRYRVSVGTFYTEYNSLSVALRAVGAIVNWHVLNEGALSDTEVNQIKAQVRLNLTTTRLPKPFQINAITSHLWDLDSQWRDLNISK